MGAQTGLTVSYFDESEAPLTLTNPYTNTTINSQIITVRVSNGIDCPQETTLELIVNPTPMVDVVTDGVFCSNYTLPNLTNGNYFTASGGNGTMLNAGDIITSSQTIFIYNETDTSPDACNNETSFSITILNNPPIDTIANQNVCNQYVLPALTNGNYFTAPNGTGTALNSGDIITTSQTIFIYNETGTSPNICRSETSFEVTITGLSLIHI